MPRNIPYDQLLESETCNSGPGVALWPSPRSPPVLSGRPSTPALLLPPDSAGGMVVRGYVPSPQPGFLWGSPVTPLPRGGRGPTPLSHRIGGKGPKEKPGRSPRWPPDSRAPRRPRRRTASPPPRSRPGDWLLPTPLPNRNRMAEGRGDGGRQRSGPSRLNDEGEHSDGGNANSVSNTANAASRIARTPFLSSTLFTTLYWVRCFFLFHFFSSMVNR